MQTVEYQVLVLPIGDQMLRRLNEEAGLGWRVVATQPVGVQESPVSPRSVPGMFCLLERPVAAASAKPEAHLPNGNGRIVMD
jgi:hypothetical protein